MSFWTQLSQNCTAFADQLSKEASKFNNRDFANAAMATCALIAAADGKIDGKERQKTAALIANNSTLKAFDVNNLKDSFNAYCDTLNSDFDFGAIDLLGVVSKLKKNEAQARAVIQIGIIIGSADGNFDDDEKAVVKKICYAVGINPEEFSL